MNILVVCYSLFGKTKKVACSLADAIGADFAEMHEIAHHPVLRAFTSGVVRACAGKSEDIVPVEADIAAYDCVVVAGPVWADHPAPALYDFVREYELTGKQTYGLLTCGRDGKRAARVLRKELEEAGSRCRSVITVKADAGTVRALRSGRIAFCLDESGKIALHARKDSSGVGIEPPAEETSEANEERTETL
jgi:flavodoxin